MKSTSGAYLEWLSVTVEPAAIQQARTLAAQADADRFEALFENLSAPFYVGPEEMSLIEGRRAQSLQRLRAALSRDQMTDAAVGAALLLCRLRDAAGRDSARRVLVSGQKEQRRRILNSINGSYYDEAETEKYRQFLFADREIVKALLQQLEDPDPEIVKAAVQCCGYLKVPGVEERLLKLLKRPDALDRGRILFWLSKGELTEELLDYAIEADAANRDESWGISVFEAFARLPEGTLQSRAQDQLRLIIDGWLDDGQRGFDGNRLSLLTTLAETADVDDVPWLSRLATTETGLYAVDPLVAWIRLEPKQGRDVLLRWLDAKERRRAAIGAAGKAFKNSADPELIERLNSLARNAEGYELSLICRALNSIGGDAAARAIESVGARLEAAELAQYRQAAVAVSLDSMVNAVEQSQLLNSGELAAARLQWSNDPGDDGRQAGLFDLFAAANSAMAFDVETGMLPCRHDELVATFMEASRGRFTPEAIHEIWHQSDDDDSEAPYTLQFVFAGRLYRGEIRNFGDWYDVERVVSMINIALKDAGLRERFIGLAADGQTAPFVFADPNLLAPIAAKFHMALSADFEEAMKKGIEFEEHVRDRLDEE